jgi:hypothetical protein
MKSIFKTFSFWQTIPEDFNLKDKIETILVDNKFDQKRARTMDMDDFIA